MLFYPCLRVLLSTARAVLPSLPRCYKEFVEERGVCYTAPGLIGFPVDVTFTRVLAAKELRHIEQQLGQGAQGAARSPMEGASLRGLCNPLPAMELAINLMISLLRQLQGF